MVGILYSSFAKLRINLPKSCAAKLFTEVSDLLPKRITNPNLRWLSITSFYSSDNAAKEVCVDNARPYCHFFNFLYEGKVKYTAIFLFHPETPGM